VELFRFVEETLEDPNSGVNGHPDGFLYWGREYYVLEVKTANNRRYKEMKKKGPFEDHMGQIQIYMKMSGVHKGVFWYYNKDTSEETLVYVDYNPKYAGFLNSKGYKMKDFWNEGKVPDRQLCPNQDCPRAKDCKVKELCWSEKYPPTPWRDVI